MPPLLAARNLAKHFAARTLFRGVSLSIDERERIALIGPNGAGKSTLLKLLAGDDKPDEGDITRRRGLRIAVVPQTDAFPEGVTAHNAVLAALDAAEDAGNLPATLHDTHERDLAADLALDEVGLAGAHTALCGALSGGQRKRLAIACAIDYGEYSLELFPFSNLQVGVATGAEDCFTLPKGHPDEGRKIAAWYFWLFPTTMFNVYPWGISINIVEPLAPDRTRVRFLPYVWDASLLNRGVSADLDRVEREDESVVEAVHRAIASRNYTTGRYSPTREQCVHHFHQLLAQMLS